MQFSRKTKCVAAGAIAVLCLAGSVLFPVDVNSAPYRRQCNPQSRQWSWKHFDNRSFLVNEDRISRYNRGIDVQTCESRRTKDFRVDCLSRVLYRMENDYSYIKIGVIQSKSWWDRMCSYYYH